MTTEKLLRKSAETIAGNECTFWACPGPFNSVGIVRRRMQYMLTCTNCQQVITINNFMIKQTGQPLQFETVFQQGVRKCQLNEKQ